MSAERRDLIPLLVAMALASLPGCGAFTLVSASEYPRDCVDDAGCAPMFEGDVCQVCTCPNAAVSSRSDVTSRVSRDFSDRRSWCGPMPAVACGPCAEAVATCVEGLCQLDVTGSP